MTIMSANMSFDEKIEKLLKYILEGDVVFFGGAGVSTASGMKDFRSEDGLYKEKNKYKDSPETILSKNFFFQHPTEFYQFYREKMNCLPFEPNVIHKVLAELEKRDLLKAVITQNIDNLHQRAGSVNVIELHGTSMKNYCTQCGEPHSIDDVFYGKNKFPKCEKCGGLVRPGITLYDERLDMEKFEQARQALNKAKTCIVAGTSLQVFPAASLISDFYGQNLVILNKEKVANEEWADIICRENMKDVFDALAKKLNINV